jgi:glycosyltransferase involved in cell wall biosynthesis
MRPYKKKKIKRRDKKFVISYIGKEFYYKGGQDVLKAYEILTKKYSDIELRFKGDIPENYLSFAKKLKGFKLIKGHFPRDELFEIMYLNSDVFVLPTHSDNFGVVFLEAMSTGLPIIGTTSFTVPEIIENGRNGFLIKTPHSWENYFKKDGNLDRRRYSKDIQKEHPEIISQLVEKISILIKGKKLREKMGKESRKMIENEEGKFSISRRNKQLRRIYSETLEN